MVKKMHTTVDSKPVDRENTRKVVDLLKAAKNPIVIAGSGLWYADAEKELIEFVEKIGIPTLRRARDGASSPTRIPSALKSLWPSGPAAAMMTLMTTDLVLFLGGRLSLFYIFGEIFPPTAKFIQVDIAPDEIGRNRTIDLGIVSDIKSFLTEINGDPG